MLLKFSTCVAVWLVCCSRWGCFGAYLKQRQADGCQRFCLDFYRPVCGSDGSTYPSDCWLANKNCENVGSPAVTVAFEGECSESNPQKAALSVAQRTDSSSNSNSDSGESRTENSNDGCPVFCPAVYSPLCASNGVTYPNACSFQSFVCNKNEPGLTVISRGECGKEPEASSIRSPPSFPGDVGNPFKTEQQKQLEQAISKPTDGSSDTKANAPPTVVLVDESRPVLSGGSPNLDRIAGDVRRTETGRPDPPYNGQVPTVTITDGFVSAPKK